MQLERFIPNMRGGVEKERFCAEKLGVKRFGNPKECVEPEKRRA